MDEACKMIFAVMVSACARPHRQVASHIATTCRATCFRTLTFLSATVGGHRARCGSILSASQQISNQVENKVCFRGAKNWFRIVFGIISS